jgi:GT2 family glycosyltransferase
MVSLDKKITFAINTTENESEYFNLLLESLYENLSHRNHEILVFIDRDRGDEVKEVLKKWRGLFNDFNIINNPLDVPVGYQRNVNILIEQAKYNIVSYLQSDMYVCKNYDIEVIKHLSPGTIVSSIRIEPPLHPEGPDKITKNFGLSPTEFNKGEFLEFCETSKEDKITQPWDEESDNTWVPFTLYKEDWLSIGGHDTWFRRACEDTDILTRLLLNGTKCVQYWSAYVYHFTCVSSRGKDWYKKEGKKRVKLQSKAQNIDSKKIIYKWGKFLRSITVNDIYKYNISAVIKNADVNINIFPNLWMFFNKIYVQNEMIKENIINVLIKNDEVDGKVFIAGEKILLDKKEWNDKYKKYFRTIEYSDIIKVHNNNEDDDIIVTFDMKDLSNKEQFDFIRNINDIVHYSTENDESYESDIFNIVVNKKDNHVNENIVVKNTELDFDLQKIKLENFIEQK